MISMVQLSILFLNVNKLSAGENGACKMEDILVELIGEVAEVIVSGIVNVVKKEKSVKKTKKKKLMSPSVRIMRRQAIRRAKEK